jgi:hypothetical protein
LSANGVEIKRRGSMLFVRDTYQDIVNTVFGEVIKDGKHVLEDTEVTQRRAFNVLKSKLQSLEANKLKVDMFEYSRGLTTNPDEYKNPNQPHVQAAIQEIKAAEAGILAEPAQAGDRIRFVSCYKSQNMYDLRKKKDHKKRKTSECAVSSKLYDPKKHIIDRKKATDDLMNPLSQIMQPLGLNPRPMIEATAKRVRTEDSRQSVLNNKPTGVHTISFEECQFEYNPPVKTFVKAMDHYVSSSSSSSNQTENSSSSSSSSKVRILKKTKRQWKPKIKTVKKIKKPTKPPRTLLDCWKVKLVK